MDGAAATVINKSLHDAMARASVQTDKKEWRVLSDISSQACIRFQHLQFCKGVAEMLMTSFPFQIKREVICRTGCMAIQGRDCILVGYVIQRYE